MARAVFYRVVVRYGARRKEYRFRRAGLEVGLKLLGLKLLSKSLTARFLNYPASRSEYLCPMGPTLEMENQRSAQCLLYMAYDKQLCLTVIRA